MEKYEIVTVGEQCAARDPISQSTSILVSDRSEADQLARKMRDIGRIFDEVLLPKIHRVSEKTAIDTLKSTETVGDGCLCIYPFEKHYIEVLFTKEIESVESDIKHLRGEVPPATEEEARHREKFAEQNRAAADMMERTYLKDLKVVRDRFKAMPKCES